MAKKVTVKIVKLLEEKGISLRELSRLTDIRHAALSELANHKRQNIHFSHIETHFPHVDLSRTIGIFCG